MKNNIITEFEFDETSQDYGKQAASIVLGLLQNQYDDGINGGVLRLREVYDKTQRVLSSLTLNQINEGLSRLHITGCIDRNAEYNKQGYFTTTSYELSYRERQREEIRKIAADVEITRDWEEHYESPGWFESDGFIYTADHEPIEFDAEICDAALVASNVNNHNVMVRLFLGMKPNKSIDWFHYNSNTTSVTEAAAAAFLAAKEQGRITTMTTTMTTTQNPTKKQQVINLTVRILTDRSGPLTQHEIAKSVVKMTNVSIEHTKTTLRFMRNSGILREVTLLNRVHNSPYLEIDTGKPYSVINGKQVSHE